MVCVQNQRSDKYSTATLIFFTHSSIVIDDFIALVLYLRIVSQVVRLWLSVAQHIIA